MPALLDGKRLMPDVKPTPEVSSSADLLWEVMLGSRIVSVGCRFLRDAGTASHSHSHSDVFQRFPGRKSPV